MTTPFCPLPFLQLLLGSNGNLSPCCLLQEVVLGNIEETPLLEAWNGEAMVNLRQEFLSGRIRTCSSNITHMKCHQWFSDLESFVVKSSYQVSPPRRLDVRLNGRCNLRCKMCDVWKSPEGPYNEENFWRLGREQIFPYLLEIDVLGGEPFVQKDTFRLIDEVSRVNPSCEWMFTTNGHWRFNGRIKGHLDRILIYQITLSVDGMTDGTFRKVRKGGDLQVLLRTLEDLVDYRHRRIQSGRGFDMGLDMAVQRDNYHEVEALIEFARNRGLDYYFLFVEHPAHLSLNGLPRREKAEVLEQLIEIAERRKCSRLESVIAPIAASMEMERLNGSQDTITF